MRTIESEADILHVNDIFRHHRMESLFIIALIVTVVIGKYATHPGVHVAGVTVLLDLILWTHIRRWRASLVFRTLFVNVISLLVILLATDPVEQWFVSLYGVFILLILLFGRNERARDENVFGDF